MVCYYNDPNKYVHQGLSMAKKQIEKVCTRTMKNGWDQYQNQTKLIKKHENTSPCKLAKHYLHGK